MASTVKLNDLFNVEGKVVVITGGGSGIGAAMALAFDANGAKSVYILGRRMPTLQATASKALCKNIKPLVADIGDKASLSQAREAIESNETHVDIFIANSGVTGPSGCIDTLLAQPNRPSLLELQSALSSIDTDAFTSTFHTNVTGTFLSAVAFLPLLHAAHECRKAGDPTPQIIITSSISAFNRSPYVGIPYASSKAASLHLMKQLSTMLAPYKIRCNAIAPGFFPSEMTEGDGVRERTLALKATFRPTKFLWREQAQTKTQQALPYSYQVEPEPMSTAAFS